MTRTLLIDSDIVAYQASSGTEGVFYFDGKDADPAVDENLDAALEYAERKIEGIANKLKATRIVICLTDDENFRKAVYPAYKGNRSGVRKPSTLRAVKDHLASKWEFYQRPGLEADDCMGILSTHATLITGEKIIVSEDKDMETIPGLLFNPRKDMKVRKIAEVEANRKFFTQVLTGDATDGYPGCRGVGPKALWVGMVQEADTAKQMWGYVMAAYASKGFTEADAIVQARCARILRAQDWDFQNKRVRLWSPPV